MFSVSVFRVLFPAPPVFIAAAFAASALTGCSTLTRPHMSPMGSDIANGADPQLIATPVVIPEPPAPAAGSLWRPGTRQFFKDSRAHAVGDIVTVLVNENATAESEANTETSRTNNTNSDVNNVANLEGSLITRHIIDPITRNLIDLDSNRSFNGEGKTDRSDSVSATIAAVVTQVLPNGYMVIQGKREVVINYELKELNIRGLIRPEDIAANNTIPSTKIAEARVFYAGRGVVDDTQTPAYGVRILDKILPF